MAATSLSVSELLFYFVNKFGKIDNKRLASIIFDFYDSDSISAARSLLINDVDNLRHEKWVKPPTRIRRDSNSAPGARVKLEIQDILSVYSFADENGLCEKLPRYVGSILNQVPTMKLEDGDIRCFMAKMEIINSNIEELNHNFLNIVPYLNKLEDKCKSLESLITQLSIQVNSSGSGSGSGVDMVDLVDKLQNLAAKFEDVRTWPMGINRIHDVPVCFENQSSETQSTTRRPFNFDQGIDLNQVRTHDRLNSVLTESQQSQSEDDVVPENNNAEGFVFPRRRETWS